MFYLVHRINETRLVLKSLGNIDFSLPGILDLI